MFFKRLSRSRSNSQSRQSSYVDANYSASSPHDSKANSQQYDHDKLLDADQELDQLPRPQSNGTREGTSHGAGRTSTSLNQHKDIGDMNNMYPARGQAEAYHSPPVSAGGRAVNGHGGYGSSGAGFESAASAPDLLTQAFNQALRPYTEKVDTLESEIADLRAYIDQLELQRGEVHAWIDKRGLRPDVPPSIAHQMDSSSTSQSPTHAAATLNAQLDRKITIVNFDLHRLQDDLNDSLPTPSFSACMLKFLPDITRLSALPSGPRYGFDLLLKLGGNLNSHGGLENGDEEDLAERRSFYGRLDAAMVDVVKGRFREEGESWGVQREIKRIEKTGAYLRNWGVEPYFPRTLEVMREGSSEGKQASAGAQSPPTYN